MTGCPCPAGSLAQVSFADGVVMLRCAAHEMQRWCLNGHPVERDVALGMLKDLFLARRGERSGTPPRPRVLRLPAAPSYDLPSPEAEDGARLTALLHARGLSGTWAVA